MANLSPRPGAEVVQQLRTVTPTVVRPQLIPVAVGPCYEIVDVLDSDGVLNASAKISVPAVIVGTDSSSTKAVAGKSVRVKVNGGGAQSFTYPTSSSGNLTAALAASLLDAGLTGLNIDLVSDALRFTTIAVGDAASIEFEPAAILVFSGAGPFAVGDVVTGGTSGASGTVVEVGATSLRLRGVGATPFDVAEAITGAPSGDAGVVVSFVDDAYTALGLDGFTLVKVTGASTYRNQDITIPFTSFPAQRGDTSQMVFDATEISLYRRQNGATKLFEDDATVLAHRFRPVATTSAQQAMHQYGVIGANSAITYVSLPGINGSELTIQHVDRGVGDPSVTEVAGDIVVTADFAGGSDTPNFVAFMVNGLLLVHVGVAGPALAAGQTLSQAVSLATGVVSGVGTGNYLTVSDVTGTFDAVNLVTASGGGTFTPSVASVSAASDKVRAYANGAGSSTALAIEAATRFVPTAIPVGHRPVAVLEFIGAVFDDKDDDSRSPDFYAKGGQAAASFGTGSAAFTITARGDQDQTEIGNFLGAAGNALSVRLTDSGALGVTMPGNELLITYDGPANGNTTTVAAIVDRITTTVEAAIQVVATIGGDEVGAGIPAAFTTTSLTGGYTPISFSAAAGRASVTGSMTAQDYDQAVMKVGIGMVTGGPFILGERVTITALKAGVIVQIDDTTDTLWILPDTPAVATTVGATLLGGSSGASAPVTSVLSPWVSAGDTLIVKFDTIGAAGATFEGPEIKVTFDGTENTMILVELAIEAAVTLVYGASAAVSIVNRSDGADPGATDPLARLKITSVVATSARPGIESTVRLSGTAVTKLFGDTATWAKAHEGTPFPVAVGDELWNGSTLLGTIAEILPLVFGTETVAGGRLRLATDALTLGTTYGQWWVKAKDIVLTSGLPASDRPLPAVIYDTAEQVANVSQNQARLVDGTLSQTGTFSMYIAYKALRTDVSASATNPALLVFESDTDVDDQIGPVTPENPLAYAVEKMRLNAGNVQVFGLGVADVSADEPFGTYAAYTSAAEFLESNEVFVIAPLTHARDVLEMFSLHATSESEAENKHERIVLGNPETPTEAAPTLVGSGEASLPSVNVLTFDPEGLDVQAALVDADVDPGGSWSDFKTAGLYVEVSNSTTRGKFSVLSVVGQSVTVATSGFDPGENDDLFYAAATLDPNADPPDIDPTGETVTMKLRGAAIDTSTSTGKTQQATALASMATAFASRRTYLIQPDAFGASVDGVEQVVEGFYVCAARAGQCAGLNPSQGFTNLPVTGFTRPIGSNDHFTETQMSIAAAGGIWFELQDTPTGPIVSRHQLSTDRTSVETSELSITKAIDFSAKVLRGSAKEYVGKYNIDEKLLDTIALVVQAVIVFLTEGQVVKGGDMNGILVDTDRPDGVLVDVTLDPLYPCNAIRITIAV